MNIRAYRHEGMRPAAWPHRAWVTRHNVTIGTPQCHMKCSGLGYDTFYIGEVEVRMQPIGCVEEALPRIGLGSV